MSSEWLRINFDSGSDNRVTYARSLMSQMCLGHCALIHLVVSRSCMPKNDDDNVIASRNPIAKNDLSMC